MANMFNGIEFKDNNKGNRYQPDVPSLTPAEMKNVLDELPLDIINQLNMNLGVMSERISNYVGEVQSGAGTGDMSTANYCNYGANAVYVPVDPLNVVSVTLNESVFFNKLTASAEFDFSSDNWYLEGTTQVTLSDYGIALDGGTPEDGDKVTVTVSADTAHPVTKSLMSVNANNLGGIPASSYVLVSAITGSATVDSTTSVIIATADWSDTGVDYNGQNIYKASYNLSSYGVEPTDNLRVYPKYTYGDYAANMAIAASWELVSASSIGDVAGEATIEFLCLGSTPSTAIPLIIEWVRGA